MNNEQLREEFLDKFAVWNSKYLWAKEDGVQSNITPDDVADWWLAKLQAEREEMEEKKLIPIDSYVSLEEVLAILVDEINAAHTTESGKTSRLTSAYNRIADLLNTKEDKLKNAKK